MTTVNEYVDWCEGFGKICPGATFTVKFKTIDEATSTAIFVCTYHATHTGEGGPVEPTNKSTDSDYVYVLKFNDEDKVESMHKTWNDSELFGASIIYLWSIYLLYIYITNQQRYPQFFPIRICNHMILCLSPFLVFPFLQRTAWAIKELGWS